MSDPKRLARASDSDLERMILRSARVKAPAASKERAVLVASAALGASAAAGGGAVAGKGTAVGLAKAGSLASIKWIGILGLVGAGTVTGALVARQLQERDAPTVEVPSTTSPTPKGARKNSASARPASQGDWTPVPVDPSTLAPALSDPPGDPSALVPGSAPASPMEATPSPASAVEPLDPSPHATPASSLPIEIAMLDDARAALAGGAPARAVAALDRYGARFPDGAMAPEATMLRIEALRALGDRGAAARVGHDFLQRDPDSPYTARVRSLLGRENE
jgi:hypothetical protein